MSKPVPPPKPPTLEKEFAKYRAEYEKDHVTVCNKACHMVGVPMIAASVLVAPFKPGLGLRLFVTGWVFQLLGHFVFERNTPTLTRIQSPWVLISSLVFVLEEWERFLRSK